MPVKRVGLYERVKKMEKINWEGFFGNLYLNIWKILGMLAAVMAVGGLSCLIYKSITADGKIDYCVIENASCRVAHHYQLYGHRSWRSDIELGTCSQQDDCKKLAEELGCHLGIK